jgi:hypothetical protein
VVIQAAMGAGAPLDHVVPVGTGPLDPASIVRIWTGTGSVAPGGGGPAPATGGT